MRGPATLSVIIPASNESELIGPCLDALAQANWVHAGHMQVVVVANGCRDNTADVARSRRPRFDARGWDLQVIERGQGGKIGALNAGDAAANAPLRAYLDADVTVSPDLPAQLVTALSVAAPRYATGTLEITAQGKIARAYARFWAQVPFMRDTVPGCGLFAVNTAGREKWAEFPSVIADDTFVRLCFTPSERVSVAASYRWPIAEGFGPLVRVRRRQDAGVAEIARIYPDLMQNEDKPPFPLREKLALARRAPLSFAVYSGVALAVRLTAHRAQGWSRGR